MPRNGSGVYSKPAGTTAVANAVIESVDYNATIDDIVADLNAARPITAGGTGATSAAGARTNLGISKIAAPADITALKALDTALYTYAYLIDSVRAGPFVWRTGDYSAHVTADGLDGFYVKADAIATTSGAWVRLSDYARLEFFGGGEGDATSGVDNTPAWNAIIALAQAGYGPRRIDFRGYNSGGTPSYYWFNTQPDIWDRCPVIDGEGTAGTLLVKNFESANIYGALLGLENGGGGGRISNLAIVSANGSNATGSLLCILAEADGAPGFSVFENLVLTKLGGANDSMHDYSLIVDGSARSIGVRDLYFANVHVFGGQVCTASFKSCVNLDWYGGGFYNAGGEASSFVEIIGTSGVPSYKVTIRTESMPDLALTFNNDCRVDVKYLDGDVTNDSTVSNFIGIGNESGTIQTGWVNSSWTNPITGVMVGSRNSNSLITETRNTGTGTGASARFLARAGSYLASFIQDIGGTAFFQTNGSQLNVQATGTNGEVFIGGPTASNLSVNDSRVECYAPTKLRSYTVAQLNALASKEAGDTAYCTNETGGAVPVYYDGTNWRRSTDRAVIS